MNWAESLDFLKAEAPTNCFSNEVMVACRPIWMAHYRVQLASLHHYSTKNSKEFSEAVKQTIIIAQKLQTIYELLDEPDDVNQMISDQTYLKAILPDDQNESDTTTQSLKPPPRGVSDHIRVFILNTNLPRLSGLRFARFLRTSSQYGLGTLWRPYFLILDQFINPLFLHLGWLFFTPRFILTIVFLLKKIWNPEQKDLAIDQRLVGYLNLHRRNFEFISDTVWLAGGIALCFILPASAVIRPFIIWGMQTSDFFVILTRSIIELRRLQILVTQAKDAPEEYKSALEARIAFEKNISYLGITNSLLMILAVSTILPIIGTLHPIIPLLGACLGLLTTLRFYWLDNLYRQKTPNIQVSHLWATIKAQSIPKPSAPSHHYAILSFLIIAPILLLGFHIHPALAFSLAFFTTLLSFNPTLQARTSSLLQTNYRHLHAFFNPQHNDDATLGLADTERKNL